MTLSDLDDSVSASPFRLTPDIDQSIASLTAFDAARTPLRELPLDVNTDLLANLDRLEQLMEVEPNEQENKRKHTHRTARREHKKRSRPLELSMSARFR
jgi:hypothetical protein